jgi:hypothetical protein
LDYEFIARNRYLLPIQSKYCKNIERKTFTMIETNTTAPQIDHNLYSRQIGAFGVEAMGKLIKLRVFIQGASGVSISKLMNYPSTNYMELVVH